MSIYQPHHAHLASGSLGDSILKIPEYVKRAKEYKLTHLTMTDHGSLSAMYSFYKECKDNDIIPIIGIEVYESTNRLEKTSKAKNYNHLILLAKNIDGLKNLFEIHNDAAMNGFYYKPRTDITMLRKYGKNLISLSGCIAGTIPQAILNNDPNKAINLIKAYKECFDEFYLELQPGTFKEQLIINNALVELAAYTHTPLIVTNDIHYLNKEDYVVHNAHVMINRKMTIDKNSKLIYPDTCYWFMNKNDIKKAFVYTDKVTEKIIEIAIENTVKIANECNIELSTNVHMPIFQVNSNETEEEVLSKLCFNKLNEIIPTLSDPSIYVERLLYELGVINQLGFCGYFLIVKDYIQWARKNNIAVGPGRGSVGGSLCAYLLDISVADPIKYGLMFERFLDPHRAAIPDIDVDFDSGEREKVFNYTVNKYGYNNCALVSTLHMRKAKSALRDSARVLGIDYEIGDEAAKLIPTVTYGDDGEKTTDLSITESLKIVPKLNELQKQYPKLFNFAIKLENLPSGSGIHAAGIIISPIKLNNKLPLIKSNKEGILATSLNLADAEMAGFVKFDYLALSTLSVIEKTQKDVGIAFDFNNNKFLSDPNVWNLIGSRQTTGLFQISSKTYKDRMFRLKPTSIQELAACLALVRGPCISSGTDKIYMEIIEGKRKVDEIHPLYYKATKDTNGVLIYQEQLMNIAVNFGFSLEEGYALMKATAKKKINKIKEFEDQFKTFAKEKNVSEEIISKIFQIIVNSGQYAFNIAHATSYALLTYASAYLKYYHYREYFTNLLTNAYIRSQKDVIEEVLDDCHRYGIKFLPLDVNESNWEFSLENNNIRIGMCAIKSFGEKAAAEILSNRPFSSLDDVLKKVTGRTFNKKIVNVAIFSGLFDNFLEDADDRLDLYKQYMKIRQEEPLEEISIGGKEKFKTNGDLTYLEKSILGGLYLSDPVNNLESVNWNKMKNKSIFTALVYVKNIKKHKDSNNKQMAFLSILTRDCCVDCIVFSSIYDKYKQLISKNSFCIIKAKKNNDNSCVLISVTEELVQ